ncbi:MAG: hypothetical protein ACOYXW_13990 [Actinomycetota bacterium]
MAAKVRTVLVWSVVVFFVYAVFTSPDQAAGLVRGALDGLTGLAGAVGAFFDALLVSA